MNSVPQADVRQAWPWRSPHQFHFYKGRVALYALLRALNVGPSDEIILPIYTCPWVVEPVVGLGARPVYCDIERETLGLAPQELETLFTDKTKAVVIQHTFGVPGRLHEVVSIARSKKTAVLEDCCHVALSTYRGTPLGRLGDAAFYSHDWDKPLSVGGGGVACINAPELLEAMKTVYLEFSHVSLREEILVASRRAFTQVKRQSRFCLPSLAARWRSHMRTEASVDQMAFPGHKLGREYGKRMPQSTERHLLRLMKDPTPRLYWRRSTITRYESGFRDLGIESFPYPQQGSLLLWRYPFFAVDKSKLLEQARKNGMSLFDWGTTPLRFLTKVRSGDGQRSQHFPVAEDIASRLVTLPVEEGPDSNEADRILDFLQSMKKRGVI